MLRKPAKGIPSWLLHVMQIGHIESIAGAAPGSYRGDPDAVYVAFQRAAGTCMLDQYLADNPITIVATHPTMNELGSGGLIGPVFVYRAKP